MGERFTSELEYLDEVVELSVDVAANVHDGVFRKVNFDKKRVPSGKRKIIFKSLSDQQMGHTFNGNNAPGRLAVANVDCI